MTGTAYKRSAEIAGVVGPYAGFNRNADAGHPRVMRKHAAANDTVRDRSELTTPGMHGTRPSKAWQPSLASNTARRTAGAMPRPRVLAPTGTIGFMMDCDTTGIEPDF